MGKAKVAALTAAGIIGLAGIGGAIYGGIQAEKVEQEKKASAIAAGSGLITQVEFERQTDELVGKEVGFKALETVGCIFAALSFVGGALALEYLD